MAKSPRVINLDDLKMSTLSKGRKFGWSGAQLSTAVGAKQIGCSVYELPAGRRSYPYHYHFANEEAIFVLEGEGTLRLAGRRVRIRQGDYVALLVGEKGAHQVINTSKKPLRFLCISTMMAPDVAMYPDSGKVGVFAATPPGRQPTKHDLRAFLRARRAVDYWDGE